MPLIFRFSVDSVNTRKREMRVRIDIPVTDFARAQQLTEMDSEVLVAMVYTENEFLALPEVSGEGDEREPG